MTELVFVDTNVLIYARDRREERKRQTARLWLEHLTATNSTRINLQVLNELTRWILANDRTTELHGIRKEVDALRYWGDKPLNHEEVTMAWTIRNRLGFQWFDCLLLAAAYQLGCRYFLTEDMVHQAQFATLTLVNPFLSSPSDILPKH